MNINGEIANGAEELASEISVVEIKMACIGFARDIHKSDFDTPDKIFVYAQKLFVWITQDD